MIIAQSQFSTAFNLYTLIFKLDVKSHFLTSQSNSCMLNSQTLRFRLPLAVMVGVELHSDAEVHHKVQMLSIYCLM